MDMELEAFWRTPHVTNYSSIAAQSESKYSSDMHKLHGGGIDRAIRCICVISVASAEPPPTQNVNSADSSRTSACHFGGSIAIYDCRECKCRNCSINCNILSI
jgi:hypothetical protein